MYFYTKEKVMYYRSMTENLCLFQIKCYRQPEKNKCPIKYINLDVIIYYISYYMVEYL